ncbi:hypothetical protein DRJ17_00245 [Candidatus Woesearchaeota archaeon]|nr:MAG: hypothetical protein DRJ17_00245 [Candidatus Woesearchaeota archaeon]
MRDGTTVEKFKIDDLMAEIQEFFNLRYFVVNNLNDENDIIKIEKIAKNKNSDVIIIKNYFKGLDNYFLKPKKIRNILYTKTIPENYLESLKKEKRKRIRHLNVRGITIKFIENLDDKNFKDWLTLYYNSISQKEKGLKLASLGWLNTKRINNQKVIGIFAFLDNRLIGGRS